MNKKAAIEWETIAKLLLGAFILVIIIIFIFAIQGNLEVLVMKLKSLLRFR